MITGTLRSMEFEAIGTHWRIDARAPFAQSMLTTIVERIERFDAAYSRFRMDSLVTRVATAAHGGVFDFPDDAEKLFDLYDQLVEATDGGVDPLVGADLERLGYDRSYSLMPNSTPQTMRRAEWRADVSRSRSTLRTTGPVVVDVGAAGKGYLVDIIADLLLDAGVSQFVIDASGDMRTVGTDTLKVGLEHPLDPSLAIGIANLRGNALCASAVNRRRWARDLHHVIDGRTGDPTRDVIATWAVAQSAVLADGIATALFFVPGLVLQESFDFASVRMLANGQVEVTENFDGELFS